MDAPELRPTHYRRPEERPFARAERKDVTILFGGLAESHCALIESFLHGLGYRAHALPTATKADFETGREYCNYGMCNPAYFTIGVLLNHLFWLRDEQGLAVDHILRDYVFVTGGSCGPCRYGTYESEYRSALRNSGFDGFRVITFAQGQSLRQSHQDAGLEMNPPFFLGLVNAVMVGDMLNEVAHRIRPYEIVPGSTHAAMARVLEDMREAFFSKSAQPLQGGWIGSFPHGDSLVHLVDQVWSRHYPDALRRAARRLDEAVQVDYLQPKPLVKVIGEIWAQTTEGDGNFRMFSYLESQGAEVLAEPVTTWLSYLTAYARDRVCERAGLGPGAINAGAWWDYWSKRALLRTTRWLVNREYDRLAKALNGSVHAQIDQEILKRLARPFFNPNYAGGEGYLEVAKNVYYGAGGLAHMVLSVKPFGCMPSTQSDGAQAAVLRAHPGILFLPIETSGEGDLNAYSRVQMTLAEARERAHAEFSACVERTGYALDDIRGYVAEHGDLRRPLQHIPVHPGVAGRAANCALHVAALMDESPAWASRRRGSSGPLRASAAKE